MSVGRPLKWKEGYVIKTVIVPREYLDIWRKAQEYSRREGRALSLVILEALSKYLEIKYPGNPQPPLESFKPKPSMALTLKAKYCARELQQAIDMLSKVHSDQARHFWSDKAKKLMLQLAGYNEKLNEDRYKKLVEKADKLLNNRA